MARSLLPCARPAPGSDAALERAESILARSPLPADTRLVKLARAAETGRTNDRRPVFPGGNDYLTDVRIARLIRSHWYRSQRPGSSGRDYEHKGLDLDCNGRRRADRPSGHG